MDYTGYFDESENTFDKTRPNLPRVYAIAGCVGLDSQWIKFQKKWRAILHRDVLSRWREVYGDKPIFFHMTDFDNPHSKIYGDWSAKKKVTFLKQLHGLMATYSLRRFASCTNMADYDALTVEERYALGNPHNFNAVHCFKLIKVWADKNKIDDRFLYVFETGSSREKELRRITNELTDEQRDGYRVKKVAFVDKRELSPLQAADILAFETRKEMCRQLDVNTTRKTRQSIQNLHVPSIDEWAYVGREHFQKILAHPIAQEWLGRPEFKVAAIEAKQKGLLL
ncbi:MAG: DUF3800 domain-containing protein [Pyrinomonadaceae bacterium]